MHSNVIVKNVWISGKNIAENMKDMEIENEHVYRDKLGRPIEADELDILLRNKEYVQINLDTKGKYVISTVWLGVPHGLAGLHYFETAVIDTTAAVGSGDRFMEIERYGTLTEAEEGHDRIVEEWDFQNGWIRQRE